MNKLLKKLILLVSCTLLFFTVQAQSSRSPLEDMANAIKNSRVSDMVKYFDNFVPITINNSQSVYSHNQAEVVLRDFFDKNIPRDFSVMDNGSPDRTSKFMIGSLIDAKGTKYSVYILMRTKDGNNYILQELRINKEAN
jgi:uncharacterized protein DUF4783